MTAHIRLFLSPPHTGPRERELVVQAIDSGYVAPAGPMLEAFEAAFAEYSGFAHSVALSSGTAALHLALLGQSVGPGDVVIAPTLTFIGGVAAIAYVGAEPIFVDCDPVSWGMDPARLDEAFDLAARRGRTVKAVVPTDLYGQCCDADAIAEVCAGRGVALVFDSAEAVGALYKGRHAGHGGLAAAFSFNGNKILTTSGGGMLCSQDRKLIEHARYLSTAARQPVVHYEHIEVGYNYRLSNLSAAVGLAQLEAIEDKVARRRAIFDGYVERLGDIPGLSFAPEAPERRHTRWLTVVLVDEAAFGAAPEEIRLALEAENIESRPAWKPMHLQPVYKGALRVGGEVSERLFATGLCLPSGTAMTEADLDRVCDVIRRIGHS